LAKNKPDYDRPKILLVDLPEECLTAVQRAGFSAAQRGTFGQPSRIPASTGVHPLKTNARLPNHTEQDIIVIDLSGAAPVDKSDHPPALSTGTPMFTQGDPDPNFDWPFWVSARSGILDARPLAMSWLRNDFDRSLQHGAMFVVFAEPRLPLEVLQGKSTGHSFRKTDAALVLDNWGFLSAVGEEYLEITSDRGSEIAMSGELSELPQLFRPFLKGARFATIIKQGRVRSACARSEERRVGKECRSRWSPYH